MARQDDPAVSQYIAAGEQMIRQHFAAGKVRATARHHEMSGKPYRPSSGTEIMKRVPKLKRCPVCCGVKEIDEESLSEIRDMLKQLVE